MAVPIIATGAALAAARATQSLARSAEAAATAVGNMAASLKNAAAAANTSVRAFYSMQASIKAASASAAGLQSALQTINKSLINAQNQAAPFNVTLKRIGVDLRAIQGANADVALKKIGGAIRDLKSPLEQQIISMEIFGERGAEMLEAFRSDNFGKAPEALRTSAALLDQNASLFASISARLETASQQVSGFFLGLRTASAPAIESMLKSFNTVDFTKIGLEVGEIFKQLTSDPKAIGENLGNALQYAIRSAGNQLVAFMEVGQSGFPKLGELLSSAFEVSFHNSRASILEMKGFLQASLLFAISEARNFFQSDFLQSAITTFRSVGQTAITALRPFADYMLRLFTESLPRAMKAAFSFALTFVSNPILGPIKALKQLAADVKPLADEIGKRMKVGIEAAANAGKRFVAPAMEGRKTFGEFLELTRDKAGIDAAKKQADDAMKRGAETLLSVIMGGMKDVFGASEFREKMNNALNGIAEAAQKVADAAQAEADAQADGSSISNKAIRQAQERRDMMGGYLNSYAQNRAQKLEARREARIRRGFGLSEMDLNPAPGYTGIPGAGLRGPKSEAEKKQLRDARQAEIQESLFKKPLQIFKKPPLPPPLPSQKKETKGMLASSTVSLDQPTINALGTAIGVELNKLIVA